MAIPAYQLIPQPGDEFSQSQSDILNNFTAIKGLIDVNHVDFSDGVNYGKHNFVEFPVQATAPTFASGEVGLYNLLPITPATGVDEMFINKIVSGGSAIQVPMSASILSTNNAPASPSNGWTYLPSGILMKWGSTTVTQSILNVVNFPSGSSIPVFNGVFSIQITQTFIGSSTAILNNALSTGNYTPTDFEVFPRPIGSPSSSTLSITYLAIGY